MAIDANASKEYSVQTHCLYSDSQLMCSVRVFVQINGNNLTFDNCDGNPSSYHVLFPNFAERVPTQYLESDVFPLCNGSVDDGSGSSGIDMIKALSVNPSTRVMPGEYFMFFESHWGGCGCYTQTDHRQSIGTILSVAIGFR